jgi:hypothetical protein
MRNCFPLGVAENICSAGFIHGSENISGLSQSLLLAVRRQFVNVAF